MSRHQSCTAFANRSRIPLEGLERHLPGGRTLWRHLRNLVLALCADAQSRSTAGVEALWPEIAEHHRSPPAGGKASPLEKIGVPAYRQSDLERSWSAYGRQGQ
jgi:hypothetical protein